MGPAHWSYAGMLAFCLIGTLWLVPAYGLTVLRRPLRVLTAIVLGSGPFLLWDLLATHAGHWRFDPAQTLPPRVLGVPLEEIGFFLVIPLASLLAYEAVRVVRGEAPGRRGRDRGQGSGSDGDSEGRIR